MARLPSIVPMKARRAAARGNQISAVPHRFSARTASVPSNGTHSGVEGQYSQSARILSTEKIGERGVTHCEHTEH